MNKIEQLFEKLSKILGVKNESELAESLNVPRSTLSSWKRRDSIPYEECIDIAKRNNISLDWLLTGEGPMYRQPLPPSQENELEVIVEWLEDWWEQANEEEKRWLKVQFGRCFPEFKEWLDRQK